MKKLRLINFITKKDYSEPLGDVKEVDDDIYEESDIEKPFL